jgi:YihY family inner membrane protein
VLHRLDAYQRRHPVVGFPIAVVYKYVDDQGNYLAALMTYYAFIGTFPLLLISSSVLGFVLRDNESLQDQVLDSALRNFPVIGDQLARPEGLEGSASAIVVGLLLSLYGSINVALAAQNAMNVAWALPRNSRPNPIAARARALLLLSTGGVGVLLISAISIAGTNADSLGMDWGRVSWLVSFATVVVTTGVFVFIFRYATPRKLTRNDVLPGAIAVAVTWHLLQQGGSAFVSRVVNNSSATTGVFALVLGLMAWLFLINVTVVMCVQINVVRKTSLFPRALLTPFTDNIDLTEADRRAYTSYALAQRTKAFAHVDVRFDDDGQHATARRTAKSAQQSSDRSADRSAQGGP